MAEPLLSIRGLSKRFGGLLASDRIDLDVTRGETHAIIGPNGAGKTTLIGQLAGDLRPDAGSIRFADQDVTRLGAPHRARRGLARSFQVTSIFRDFSALDNVAFAVQAHRGSSFRFWRPARSEPALRGPARVALESVGLGGRADVRAANLAHGEQRQLEIAMALATEPRLLLLDEALAGLTPSEIQQAIALVRAIHHMGVTLLIVEHLMEVIFTLAPRVIVFNQGKIIAEGAPGEIVNDPLVVNAYLGKRRPGGRAP